MPPMFGPRLNTVFQSPGKALIWSAFILLTAYCTVPSRERTDAEAKAAHAAKHHGGNPWAKQVQ